MPTEPSGRSRYPELEQGLLFGAALADDALLTATGDRAWLQAMLDVEAQWALARADAGLLAEEAARAVVAACQADRFDLPAIAQAAREGGNPVIPMVAALRQAVGTEAGDAVHRGATSQDVIDSAMMLVAKRALQLIESDLDQLAGGLAALAERHRGDLMPGRTLLQQALPLTFGLKAARWLSGVLAVRDRLQAVDDSLPVQLGGAVGTAASLGDNGPDLIRRLAGRLGLAEPLLPWHTDRTVVANLAAALGLAAGVSGKVALDIILLSQTEVGEVQEGARGEGGSSTLPHKRNPVASISVLTACRRAQSQVALIFQAMIQAHERAIGAWQTEWQALTDLLRLTGGAVCKMAKIVSELEIHTVRMRTNLDATGGLWMAERITERLADAVGYDRARTLVEAAVSATAATGRSFADVLLSNPTVAEVVDREELDALLRPDGYLGASDLFIDRVLERYHRSLTGS